MRTFFAGEPLFEAPGAPGGGFSQQMPGSRDRIQGEKVRSREGNDLARQSDEGFEPVLGHLPHSVDEMSARREVAETLAVVFDPHLGNEDAPDQSRHAEGMDLRQPTDVAGQALRLGGSDLQREQRK